MECDEDNTPQSISYTENWLNWNGDLKYAKDSEDDCTADVESDIEEDNGMEDPESPQQRDVSAAQNVAGLIRPKLLRASVLGYPAMVWVGTGTVAPVDSGIAMEPNRPMMRSSKHEPHPTASFLAGFYILQSLIFANSELWLEASISVMIVSQCDIYVKDAVLHSLSPLALQFLFRSIVVELL